MNLEKNINPQCIVGGCYKAANWVYVGKTTGRGKLDRNNKATLPVKNVWLYPLTKRFKKILCVS